MSTQELIARLEQEAATAARGRLRPPLGLSLQLVGLLLAYGAGTLAFLGLRPDLALQFSRPLFALEIAALAALAIGGAVAAVIAMYPDAHQKPGLLHLPFGLFLLLAGLMLLQLFLPPETAMALPDPHSSHSVECTICIAAVALIPSAGIFLLLRRGATVRQFRSGAYAVLTASAIGCLSLRLAEANDSIPHLLRWHYLPTLFFAAAGALLGRRLLKW